MSPEQLTFLTLAILIVAFLYSCVGHAGASGYIAVMTLFSLAPAEIKPTALVLNILVASIGTWQFWRAGYFSWSLFWPFALAGGADGVPRRLSESADAGIQDAGGHGADIFGGEVFLAVGG